MSDKKPMGQVIEIDEARIRDHPGEMVRGTVEQTLNAMLDAEANQHCGAGSLQAQRSSAGYTGWQLRANAQTSAGEVSLKVPKLRRQTLETAIIERYRRQVNSVEEALIEMRRFIAERTAIRQTELNALAAEANDLDVTERAGDELPEMVSSANGAEHEGAEPPTLPKMVFITLELAKAAGRKGVDAAKIVSIINRAGNRTSPLGMAPDTFGAWSKRKGA